MESFGCVANKIKVRSGRYFDLADPQPDQITFEDIAIPLSRICRFGGHCRVFYSVAEHLWHCAIQAQRDGLPADGRRAVLLHDAAEAFIGDMVRPLKLMMPRFSELEATICRAIEKRFSVDFKRWADDIRRIDNAMLIAERRVLFDPDGITWEGQDSVPVLSPGFEFFDPAAAEARFTDAAASVYINVAG